MIGVNEQNVVELEPVGRRCRWLTHVSNVHECHNRNPFVSLAKFEVFLF